VLHNAKRCQQKSVDYLTYYLLTSATQNTWPMINGARAARPISLPVTLCGCRRRAFISFSLAEHFKYSMIASGAGNLILISFGARMGNSQNSTT
jgi:hypothetical protein